MELELLDAKDALVARRRECVRLRVLAEEATAARDAASSGATRTREEKEKRSLAVGYAMARAKRRVELGRRFRAWSSWASRSLARRWCDARGRGDDAVAHPRELVPFREERRREPA